MHVRQSLRYVRQWIMHTYYSGTLGTSQRFRIRGNTKYLTVIIVVIVVIIIVIIVMIVIFMSCRGSNLP